MYYLHRSSFSEMTHLSAGNIGDDLLRATAIRRYQSPGLFG